MGKCGLGLGAPQTSMALTPPQYFKSVDLGPILDNFGHDYSSPFKLFSLFAYPLAS